jgi:hypothetical protein
MATVVVPTAVSQSASCWERTAMGETALSALTAMSHCET